MTAVVAIFAAATWGCLLYFLVFEPVRLYLHRKPHPRREEFQEREAHAALWPTTERRVIGQPADPIDLQTRRAGGGRTPRLMDHRR